jgi:hypothetical protein
MTDMARAPLICNRYGYVYHLSANKLIRWWALCGVTGWITTDTKKRRLCKRCEKIDSATAK